MSRNVIIVGANRGIGLELVKCYKKQGDDVIAVCRQASDELKALDVTLVEGIDVKKDTTVADLASKIPFSKIDILIHNAGILRGDSFQNLNLEDMREQFEVNSLGPLKTVMSLHELFKEGTKVGLVSSRVGSIDDNSSGQNYGYRASKTALNMIGTNLALEFKDKGVAFALLHPGYVRTEMTGGGGLIDPDEAAAGLYQRMEELSIETTGLFVHSSGEKLHW